MRRRTRGPRARSSRKTAVVAAAVTLLAAGCGARETGPSPYQQAELRNALEVPPGLSPVERSESTAIPERASRRLGSDEREDYVDYQRFKRWEEFQAFQDYKRQRREAGIGPGGAAEDVELVQGGEGIAAVRVASEFDDVWLRVGVSLSRLGLIIESRDRAGGTFSVYASDSGDAGFVARLVRGKGSRLNVGLTQEAEAVVVAVTGPEGETLAPEIGQPIVDGLYRELRSFTSWTAGGKPSPGGVKIGRDDRGRLVLLINEGVDQTWRRVGAGLDRGGFTVEDRDRASGVYLVRYIPPGAVENTGKKKGLGRLKFWKRTPAPQAGDYRIVLVGSDERTEITVESPAGPSARDETGEQILRLLYQQLDAA